jgi:hypothetical protein
VEQGVVYVLFNDRFAGSIECGDDLVSVISCGKYYKCASRSGIVKVEVGKAKGRGFRGKNR